MRQSMAGLSLLEMLVTLLVSGLALLLLTQAIGQYHQAQSSVLQFERAGREYRMGEAWWRASVEGLQAIEEAPFEGNPQGFNGVTLSPVMALQGTPSKQSWRTVFADDGGWALAVEEAGRSIILPLNQAEEPAFSYLDADGEWHSNWPPGLGTQTSLPEAVSLRLGSSGTSDELKVIVAAVVGSKRPVYVQFEPGDL